MRKQISHILTLILIGSAFLPNILNAQLNTGSLDSLLNRGDSLFSENRYTRAREAYKKILTIDNDNIHAYAGLGKIAVAQKKWKTGGDTFQQVLDSDPENIEAHYYRGICTRETGKFKVLLLRKLDWNKSKKHLQWVMAHDSLYRDVIYQYARLQRYRKQYKDAIALLHRQIQLRPELVEPQVKLFRFYRYLISHTRKKEAIDWLCRQPWDQATYAIGEALRRSGDLVQADSVFLSLLRRPVTMSRQPIFLSLAKIYYGQDKPQKAEKFYWLAVNGIRNEVDAGLVFEDVKYILTDPELDAYQSLATIPEKIDFFKALWVSRDPTPASSRNYRLAEHYRRLNYAEKNFEYDSFRTWFNNPDKLGYLDFTRTYELNHEFNDKGLIYIRHGQYDDWAITAGDGIPSNETWIYYKTEATPRMDFHFVLENTAGYWRFIPIITDPRMLGDRLGFGNIYFKLYRATELERVAYADEMARDSRKYVATGLATDRHTWDKKIKPLETPFSMTTFRGDSGKTVIEIYNAFSLAKLAGKNKNPNIEIEKGLTVHNMAWQQIEKFNEKMVVPIRKSESFIDLYRFEVQPDSYHVAFYLRPQGTDFLGGWKYEKRVPDYSNPGLSISDIELATRIEPVSQASKFAKNGLQVIPNPTRLFSLKSPVYIYFEIYQLGTDPAGKTSFTIEYTLTLLEAKPKGIMRLFGSGGKSSITTQVAREGRGEFSVEYLAINAGRLKPGEYKLVVKVTDRHNGKSAFQTKGVALK